MLTVCISITYKGHRKVSGSGEHARDYDPKMLEVKAFTLANELKKFKLYLWHGNNPSCWVFLSNFVHDQLKRGAKLYDIPAHAAPFSLDSPYGEPTDLTGSATKEQLQLQVLRQKNKLLKEAKKIEELESQVEELETDRRNWDETFGQKKESWQDDVARLRHENLVLATKF